MMHQQILAGFLLAVAVGCCFVGTADSKAKEKQIVPRTLQFQLECQLMMELTKEEKEQMMAVAKECQKTTKVDLKELEAMKKNPSAMPSHKVQCFMKCFSEKMGGMKADGTIDDVGTKAMLQETVSDQAMLAKMNAGVDECKAAGVAGGDPCETAMKNVLCLQKKFKEAGFNPSVLMP